MSYSKRMENLRGLILEKNLDAVLISSCESLLYFCGTSLVRGFLAVTKEAACLFTDYEVQSPNSEIENIYQQGRIYQNIAAFFYKNNVKTVGFEDKSLTVNEYKRLNYSEHNLDFIPLKDSLVYLRAQKDEEELKNLAIAARISDEVFTRIIDNFNVGMTERELASFIDLTARKLGADGVSFDTVVSSGKNSALLHKKNTDKEIEHGDILVIDYGILYQGYTVDMTRTVFVGEILERAKEIYNIVYYAFVKTIDRIRDNVKAADIDKCARDIISSFGYGENFLHSTGHGVGLSIHEAPFISAQSPDTLKENMAIAVEPGIYVADFGGFRIEDTLVVRQDEAEFLTKSPKEIIIL